MEMWHEDGEHLHSQSTFSKIYQKLHKFVVCSRAFSPWTSLISYRAHVFPIKANYTNSC